LSLTPAWQLSFEQQIQGTGIYGSRGQQTVVQCLFWEALVAPTTFTTPVGDTILRIATLEN
jgi:hypothetical protein